MRGPGTEDKKDGNFIIVYLMILLVYMAYEHDTAVERVCDREFGDYIASTCSKMRIEHAVSSTHAYLPRTVEQCSV